MINIEKHWLLKEHLEEIEVLSDDFPEYYRGIPKGSAIPINTDINSKRLIFGYNGPIIRLNVELFISKWYDFVKSAFFETCIWGAKNGLIMEFTSDDYLLQSGSSYIFAQMSNRK
ncbi:hypothetical protein F0L74_20905 [Chitinophaga agrisoli]|uniref:Uncharacterized protein n=1 Tax=Chitinophaga agrisoli TaxID=2607653 RepID=A0A5B2VHX5_9BACT|nr:hypothetical protein [Chitinophaga agrisoli]KAA2238681.1 hypothetical protein F0L74_20905 [Chitinophaga agrisoli]